MGLPIGQGNTSSLRSEGAREAEKSLQSAVGSRQSAVFSRESDKSDKSDKSDRL